MKQQSKFTKVLKEITIMVALPLCVFALVEILLYVTKGAHIFNSELDVKNLIRNAGIVAALAFALNMNMDAGRMDMSLGAQRVAGTICGGLLAQTLGLGGVWVLVFSIAFGLIYGALVGWAFVTLRVPPMVLGLGMSCILECIGFAVSGGVGLKLVGSEGIEVLSNVNFTITVVAIMAVFMLILMTYSTFSYKYRAVSGNQNIARNAGINIFTNVVICYTIGGALVCVGGVLSAAFSGSLDATMGMTSNGVVLNQLFVMMLGGSYLSRYINQAMGIISASVAMSVFTMGLTAFNVSDAMASSIKMILFIIFLTYMANEHLYQQHKADKARIAQAQAIKAERAKANAA